ncbi:MAG: hypothetical protein JL50_10495 [Peptococcaceae bacterium BICA1-7]|nr:MAG: hypothetical protein JL50_10495 [Peptococcaceae bacterium BICA1-7]HBV95712.1 hypothetical protein [Desulfotomaculum sp.]
MAVIFFILGEGGKETGRLVLEAQSGDTAAREKIISENLVFIKKIVSKNSTGYEDIDSRDEYSVGLMAFNEAIDGYKPGLRSFQSFAADVIRKRIIDHHRSRSSYLARNLYVLDTETFSDPRATFSPTDQVHIRMEMELFVKKLSLYNIGLKDLLDETPRHADSRLLCVRMAKIITAEPELRHHFIKYRTIPLKMLLQKITINRKTVERHRRYIIAICLVLMSELDTMKEYVESLYKGGEDHGRQGNSY